MKNEDGLAVAVAAPKHHPRFDRMHMVAILRWVELSLSNPRYDGHAALRELRRRTKDEIPADLLWVVEKLTEVSARGFYGTLTVSLQNGKPTIVQTTETLKGPLQAKGAGR